MLETTESTQLYRFDQMAVQVKDKVEPEDADVDRYVGLEHIDPESLKIRRWGEPSDVESSKILFKSGDIIFGKRRAYQRKLAVADFDGICSAHAMVLRPKTDVVLEEFMPFFMQSDIFMEHAVKISVGGLSPTINWRDLAREEFTLPPLGEQRRIAEVLQAVNFCQEKLLLGQDLLITTLDSAAIHVLSSHACEHSIADYFDVNPESLTKGQLSSDEVWEYADLGSAAFPLRLAGLESIRLSEAPSRAKRVATNGDILVSTVRPNLKGHVFVSSLDSKIVASTGFAVLRPKKKDFANVVAGIILSSRFLQYCEGRVSGGLYPAIRASDVSCFPVPDLDLLGRKRYGRMFERLLRALDETQSRRLACSELKKSEERASAMTFNEANTVEAFVRDLLCGGTTNRTAIGSGLARAGNQLSGLGWHYLSHENLPRQSQEALVEEHLSEALIRLNPRIAAQPDRVDDVLYRLRAIIMGVRSDGLVKANEEFAAWLTGERSMPFGENGEHVTIKLIDFDDLEQNQYVVTRQYTFRAGKTEKRADLVLLINGMPLVMIEAKTPVRSSQSWLDGALQVHDDYERNIPELFVPNVFSIATEGKEYRYGSIRMPVEFWGPWRLEDEDAIPSIEEIGKAVNSMLRPNVVLDLLSSFTSYATLKGKHRIKIIARYQQYEGTNKLVERVVAGHPKKGLIWHFQGSGKSLLMLFAAKKLRLHKALKNPTVMIVVDRIDLDSQIAGTFYANDAQNLVKAESRKDLQDLLDKDVRKIIITTVHKFGEADGVLNDRHNIILMVDEAHRTQEGDLGRQMRAALPNAFLFGLTGTPINRADRNTFYAFGADEDENGYMSRYGFEESVRDGATKQLHFEPRLVDLHVDQESIDEAFAELTAGLTDEERNELSKSAAKMAILLKAPERISAVCADIAQHFQEKVAANGFAAQVVTIDRESCLLYKQELDKHLPPEVSDIVMSINSGEDQYGAFRRDRDAEEKLLDRFRDPNDPLKIIIVTAKLLTGFDAPILQTMYLDKPLRDHTLLQAICRTNRPYGQEKTHGLIVDYLGVFDDVAQAIQFDEEGITRVISNIAELKAKLPQAIQKCLEYFPGVDRGVGGYEGLISAQDCLPNNDVRDRFAADCSYLARLWEAISPDPMLNDHETDYRWIVQVYESVKPTTGTGKLIWHKLGAKTIELVHENVHVYAVKDDLETLVLDADLLEAVLGTPDPDKKSKEIDIKVSRRLRKHLHDPRFKALAERLEELRQRHEQGLLISVEFLKELLDLARDVVATEQASPPIEQEDRGKAALTELFEDAKNSDTPIMVERVVDDIDKLVRTVRFNGWQETHAGEREVKKALRKTLFKYQLHQDTDLFDRAYGYICEYY